MKTTEKAKEETNENTPDQQVQILVLSGFDSIQDLYTKLYGIQRD